MEKYYIDSVLKEMFNYKSYSELFEIKRIGQHMMPFVLSQDETKIFEGINNLRELANKGVEFIKNSKKLSEMESILISIINEADSAMKYQDEKTVIAGHITNLSDHEFRHRLNYLFHRTSDNIDHQIRQNIEKAEKNYLSSHLGFSKVCHAVFKYIPILESRYIQLGGNLSGTDELTKTEEIPRPT